MKPLLDQRYGQLCQELGNLICTMEKVQAKIIAVKTEINGLDQTAALIRATAQPELKAAPSGGKVADGK